MPRVVGPDMVEPVTRGLMGAIDVDDGATTSRSRCCRPWSRTCGSAPIWIRAGSPRSVRTRPRPR